jgi:hypothetical protein
VVADRKSGASQDAIREEQPGKYPEGRWMVGIGMGLSVVLGVPMGLAMDNIAVGPAFGLCIGVVLGATLERKHKVEMRPLTAEEKGFALGSRRSGWSWLRSWRHALPSYCT